MRWADWHDRWPHAAASRFVEAGPYRWHVQQMGSGPDLVLLHGAGGATHSWRGLMPLLAQTHRCTAMDLPGHGFTNRAAGRSGLEEMAADLRTLLDALGIRPAVLVGHSAGAAIALRMAQTEPVPVVSINGAFAMFEGPARWLFPLIARGLAFNPLTVPLFRATATRARIRRMLEGTGSAIDEDGHRLYAALISDHDHVAGTLAKMASWRLEALHAAAAGTDAPVLMLVSDRDRTVPPRVSRSMAAKLPHARVEMLAGTGHLAHEEAPERVAAAIAAWLAEVGSRRR